ncbi:N2227-like protein [Musa troglodytarum]|uniref:N2227-like protein n=1 Tax=Musa troglodytarum TaxID=320322 RepID=A0A9E7GRS5_9LILI|nr:N2227-like protein [Musa troglodytarum]
MDRRQHEEEVRVDEAAATTGQRRYSKLEEALEIKSLRRIISAYLKVKRNVTNVINLFLRSLIAYFHIVPKTDSDQLRSVSFPDIHPSSAGITEGFSMCAGDFVEVYNDESQEAYWDAVVTCFFVDTAHNIVEYIETISKLLKTGGEMSIELSLEDVKKIAFHFGFVMEKEKVIETTYTANPRSMMQHFLFLLKYYY